MPRSQIPRARGSKMLSGCKVRPAYDRDCVGPSAEKQKMVQFDPKSVRIVCCPVTIWWRHWIVTVGWVRLRVNIRMPNDRENRRRCALKVARFRVNIRMPN